MNRDRVRRLRRLQWGVRGALALGVAASIAANILHAQPSVVGRAISAWSPIALLITVELISRVPVHRRVLAVVGRAATATVAGIAAWVSYGHMVSVAARYGESDISAHLLPLSVDGLVVVASIALLEVGGQIRAELGDVHEATAATVVEPAAPDVPVATAAPTGDPSPAPVAVSTAAADVATGQEAVSTPRPAVVSAPPRGAGRRAVAAERAAIPADDPRSQREIAEHIAARTGLKAATVRAYLRSSNGVEVSA